MPTGIATIRAINKAIPARAALIGIARLNSDTAVRLVRRDLPRSPPKMPHRQSTPHPAAQPLSWSKSWMSLRFLFILRFSTVVRLVALDQLKPRSRVTRIAPPSPTTSPLTESLKIMDFQIAGKIGYSEVARCCRRHLCGQSPHFFLPPSPSLDRRGLHPATLPRSRWTA